MDINEILDQVIVLPKASKENFLKGISEHSYPKGHHLFFENQRVDTFYFLKSGICRAYTNRDGKEVTFYFGTDGDIIFPLQTRYNPEETYETIELLDDCSFYEISISDLQTLFLTDIHIANWGRMSIEREFIKAERLFIARQFKTSAERYNELLIQIPNITQRVSLGIIATYLGITQVNLSRIRRKK